MLWLRKSFWRSIAGKRVKTKIANGVEGTYNSHTGEKIRSSLESLELKPDHGGKKGGRHRAQEGEKRSVVSKKMTKKTTEG